VVAKAIQDTQELCDETCEGTGVLDKTSLKEKMLDEHLAVNLSDIFKTLGDPTRVKIIYALVQKLQHIKHE
jgi:hypothetical protein